MELNLDLDHNQRQRLMALLLSTHSELEQRRPKPAEDIEVLAELVNAMEDQIPAEDEYIYRGVKIVFTGDEWMLSGFNPKAVLDKMGGPHSTDYPTYGDVDEFKAAVDRRL